MPFWRASWFISIPCLASASCCSWTFRLAITFCTYIISCGGDGDKAVKLDRDNPTQTKQKSEMTKDRWKTFTRERTGVIWSPNENMEAFDKKTLYHLFLYDYFLLNMYLKFQVWDGTATHCPGNLMWKMQTGAPSARTNHYRCPNTRHTLKVNFNPGLNPTVNLNLKSARTVTQTSRIAVKRSTM